VTHHSADLGGPAAPRACFTYLWGERITRRVAPDWLGWIDPANFYRRIDVAVVPSLWAEPLGAVNEAHCCGVPTVVSANGGTPEVVEDGKTGFIYRRDTVEELARTFLRFVDEPHLANGMRPSILEAAKRYAAPGIAREHLELYNVLLGADFLKRPLARRSGAEEAVR
jgi:glycosyltransferase involved in cell wall biosynthesis